MPPRSIPKVYQLLVKTHKLTIFHTVLPPTSVASIKADTLSALASDVNQADDVPQVSSVDDFELCRAVKDAKGNLTGEYLALDSSKQIKDFGLGGWDHLYIRFKDPDTEMLQPVVYTEPSIEDEVEDTFTLPDSPMEETPVVPRNSKGKRKARSDDEFDEDDY